MKIKKQQRLDKEEMGKNKIENAQKFEEINASIENVRKTLLNHILEILDKMNNDLKEEIGKKADRLDVKKLTPKFGK